MTSTLIPLHGDPSVQPPGFNTPGKPLAGAFNGARPSYSKLPEPSCPTSRQRGAGSSASQAGAAYPSRAATHAA